MCVCVGGGRGGEGGRGLTFFQKVGKAGSWGIPQSELGVDGSGGVTFF